MEHDFDLKTKSIQSLTHARMMLEQKIIVNIVTNKNMGRMFIIVSINYGFCYWVNESIVIINPVNNRMGISRNKMDVYLKKIYNWICFIYIKNIKK